MENSSHYNDNNEFVPDPRADMEMVEDIYVMIADRIEIYAREYEDAKKNLRNLEQSLERYQRRVERAEQDLKDVKAERAKHYRDPKGKLPPSDTEYRIKLEEAKDMVEEIEELIKDARQFVKEARDNLDNQFWMALHGQDGAYLNYKSGCITALQRVIDLNRKWEIAVTTLKRREGRRLYHTEYEKDPFVNTLKVLPVELYRDINALLEAHRNSPMSPSDLHKQYEQIGSLPGDEDWVEPPKAIPAKLLKAYNQEAKRKVQPVAGEGEVTYLDDGRAPVVEGLRRLSESEAANIKVQGDTVNISDYTRELIKKGNE